MSEDLISKQAVIEVIKSMPNDNPSYWNSCDVIDRENTLDEIEDLQPVNPEPKIGQWIYCYTNGFGRQILKCSKCGFKGDTLGFNYCPNCGQPKMQEVEE